MRPLRLLHWNGARVWAGAEVRLVECTSRLAERGHSVRCVARNAAPLICRLQDHGIPTHAIAPHGAADLPRIAQVARLARQMRADLIHAHAGRDYVPAILAGWLARCPVVLHRHLLSPLRPTSRPFVRRAAAVIAVSTPVRNTLLQHDCLPPERVHLIPMAVDLERVQQVTQDLARLRRELAPASVPLILSVGHLYASKGHDDLVQAAALLRNRGQRFALVIAGEGPRQHILARQIEDAGLQACVRLLGARCDIPDLLAACDCFILLSQEDPFPGAVLEAMAAGKPVVACAAGGVPDMVRDGETGILVPPGSPAQAAAALQQLLDDAPLRARLGAAAAHRARTEFRLDQMLDAWERVYAAAVGQSRGGNRGTGRR